MEFILQFKKLYFQYETVPRGKKYSEASGLEYKIYFKDSDGNLVSPWHDVPLLTETDPTNQVLKQF